MKFLSACYITKRHLHLQRVQIRRCALQDVWCQDVDVIPCQVPGKNELWKSLKGGFFEMKIELGRKINN